MKIKPKKIWVLVADGTRARIFIKSHNGLNSAFKQDLIGENLKDREIYMDKPGRNFQSSSPRRSAYQPKTDWHQYQKHLFAKELCEILDKANEKCEFDELVIISPPKTLGDIRGQLGKQSLSKVTAEIPKDVSKFTEHELVDYLDRELV